MNRAYTTVALHSALASAILAIAPLAGAATTVGGTQEAHAPVLAPFVSQVSREQVRSDAIAAARQVYSHTDQQHEPRLVAQGPALSRAEVHAEAVEATRLGLSFSGEYGRELPAAQPAQTRVAGLQMASVIR